METIKLHRKPGAAGAHIVITSSAGANGGSACEAKLLEKTLHETLPRDAYNALIGEMLNRRAEERLAEIAEQVVTSA
jgi:hypothetical protein